MHQSLRCTALHWSFCTQAYALTPWDPCSLQVRTIAELVLAQTAARLAERDVGLEVTAAAMAQVCELGYDQVHPTLYPILPPSRPLSGTVQQP